jgi:hypothetical protein
MVIEEFARVTVTAAAELLKRYIAVTFAKVFAVVIAVLVEPTIRMVAATIFPLKKELPSYLPKVLTL